MFNLWKRKLKVQLSKIRTNECLDFKYILYDNGYSIIYQKENHKINITILYSKEHNDKEFSYKEIRNLKEQLPKILSSFKIENWCGDIDRLFFSNNVHYSTMDIKHFFIYEDREELIDCVEFQDNKLKKFAVTRNGAIIFLTDPKNNILSSYEENEYSILLEPKEYFDYELHLIPRTKRHKNNLSDDVFESDGISKRKKLKK